MLKEKEFDLLIVIKNFPKLTQRELSCKLDCSLGTVNSTLKTLEEKQLINNRVITHKGLKALEPYKVENAVIMAAGMSTRFLPLSYERPKGALKVRGEVLIERQIKQLLDAGISNISVVVGYMKEAFFYLEDMFGVNIIENQEFSTRNNHSSLYVAAHLLSNTYVCSSDDYFTKNVFEPYVFKAYYSACYFAGKTNEYCVKTARSSKRISEVTIGGENSYAMLGHVYFDRKFSEKLSQIIAREYNFPDTKDKLWEDLFIDHIKDFDMDIRRYEDGVIYEFDSINDLKDFDTDFINNIDSEILDNICSVLNCNRSDVCNIEKIKGGYTNFTFKFDIASKSYTYRHPGTGTDKIINRESESATLKIVSELGIDTTYIYDHPHGWKISRFIENSSVLDMSDAHNVEETLKKLRAMHTSGHKTNWTFDHIDKANQMILLLEAMSYPKFKGFDEVNAAAKKVNELVCKNGIDLCLCHNDFYYGNVLVSTSGLDLIDWEYSAMSNFASDLGTFIYCSERTEQQADEIFEIYFGRELTSEEYRHCVAYVGIASYYWFVWSLYKGAVGDPVDEWLYRCYKYAKFYLNKALSLYGQA